MQSDQELLKASEMERLAYQVMNGLNELYLYMRNNQWSENDLACLKHVYNLLEDVSFSEENEDG